MKLGDVFSHDVALPLRGLKLLGIDADLRHLRGNEQEAASAAAWLFAIANGIKVLAHADPGGYIGHPVASLRDLFDRFDLEFFGIWLLCHGTSYWCLRFEARRCLVQPGRFNVLCQLGEARATIELKMSERWTVDDYLVALDDQLRGQYMQAANSKIGFFVVVLQRRRQWNAPTGGRLDFAGLVTLLQKRALELQAADPTLFLRVVGINATPQVDFRAARAAAKAASKGPAKYADQAGNTWSGKGPRPKWLKDALAAGKQLAQFST